MDNILYSIKWTHLIQYRQGNDWCYMGKAMPPISLGEEVKRMENHDSNVEIPLKKGVQFTISQHDRVTLFLFRNLANSTSKYLHTLFESFEATFPEWPVSKSQFYKTAQILVDQGYLDYEWSDPDSRYKKRVRITESGYRKYQQMLQDFNPVIQTAYRRLKSLVDWMTKA